MGLLTCQHCRREFEPQRFDASTKRNKFCSMECKQHSRRLADDERPLLTCANCGASYLSKNRDTSSSRRTMCRACRVARTAAAQNRPSRTCTYCGVDYVPERWSGTSPGNVNFFCSRKCKGKHRASTPEHKADMRRRYYVRKYGMSVEDAERMRTAGCAICGCANGDNNGRWDGQLHIDHDHATGKVRGVLCNGCNVSIGHFRDDPALLRAAADYLEAVVTS